MIVSPLPGTSRKGLREALRHLHTTVSNLRSGSATGGSYQWLVAYLGWANEAARMLRSQVSAKDIDRLVLTKRYELLLSMVGRSFPEMNEPASIPSPAAYRSAPAVPVLNDLLAIELEERTAAFEEVVAALNRQIERWSRLGEFVVMDTSVYLTYPDKLEEWDVASLIEVHGVDIHMLVPLVVVDELDGLKLRGDTHGRWRAAHSLAVLDRVLADPTQPGQFRPGHLPPLGPGGGRRGEVSVELLFDPPGHIRLPINDEEIIDRTLAAQSLAARPITLITYDTNQSFRARAAGLRVKRLPMPIENEPEPEPKPRSKTRRTDRDRAERNSGSNPP